MRRILAALICFFAFACPVWAQNTYNAPPPGQPVAVRAGVANPPAPTISGAGASGGTTTYTYAVVAYGHDSSGNSAQTLMGATAQTTTGQAVLSSGTPIVLTTQSDPGAIEYDFLKQVSGTWESICLGVAATTWAASGVTCSDTGQTPSAYTLPQANETADLVAAYASIANGISSAVPINTAPAQTGNYSAQGYDISSVGALAAKSTNNNVQYADQFTGTTWAEKVNAAVAALPSTGGTVDAQGMCLGGALSAADTNVVLGSATKPIKLALGACTYPLGAHSIQYYNNDEIGGVGSTATTITYTGGGSAIAPASTVAVTVNFHDFKVTGDDTAGTIGIDMTYAAYSTLARIILTSEDTGYKVGGTVTGAYYNKIDQVVALETGTNGSHGGWLAGYANQNQIFGGAVRANSSTGVGLEIGDSSHSAASNQVYSLDCESSAHYCFQLDTNANGNVIVNPYMEGAGGINIQSGANRNAIIGGGGGFQPSTVTDSSGNTTNYIHNIGGGGGTSGITPYYDGVADGLLFGTDFSGNALKVLSDVGEPRNPLALSWNTGTGTTGSIENQYGMFGHAPLEIGEALIDGGAHIQGLATTTAIGTPAAPTITQGGTGGATSYSYYLVCHDKNGGVTLPSAAGSTTTGNATLDATNYNLISWTAIDGCWQYDILKGNTSTSLAVNQYVALPLGSSTMSFKDTGQSTSAYTAPTQNTTADVKVSGAFNPATSQTSLTGTSGTASCSESMQGTALKVANCYLNGYAETGSAQTFSFPTAFSTAPTIQSPNCGTYPPSTTASVLTLPANASMTATTCQITLIGQ